MDDDVEDGDEPEADVAEVDGEGHVHLLLVRQHLVRTEFLGELIEKQGSQ